MAGKKVTQVGDQLHPITLERFYNGLIADNGLVFDMVQQLRSVKTIDPIAYRKAKTMLPYVVCAMFSPPVRRKENFAYTQCFMVDIDKLSQVDMTPDGVKRLLEKDERITLMFTSPGNDGVKVLFTLTEKMHDAGYYSYFYKAFAAGFAAQYQLQGAVDLVTSDVSRCCFMSHDPKTFYRPEAMPVHAADYANPQNLFDEPKPKKEENTESKEEKATMEMAVEKVAKELPPDVLQMIKEKLNPALANRSMKPPKQFIQPEELNAALPALTESLIMYNMQLAAAKPISYGKQLKITAGAYWAEINLFYGKGNFTAVKTTKTGSHPELAELAKQVIDLHFTQQQKLTLYAPPQASSPQPQRKA